jgi:hypothetical protein
VHSGTLAHATDYSPAVSPVDPEELAATIGTRLGGDGWTVIGHPSTPPRFTFVFAHPLTADCILSVDPTAGSAEDTVERFLGRPEFDVISKAPKDLPHASLVRSLRENARGEKWPPSVLQGVARVLRGHDLLTSGEADWLTQAGPCWLDAD